MFNKTNKVASTRGSILILVLIVTASLTAIAFSLAYRCQIELRLAKASCQQIQLHYLAYGGLQRCLALLSQQKLDSKTAFHVSHFFSSSIQEALWSPGDMRNSDPLCLFYWINDENSFLSVNKSDPSCWEKIGLLDISQIACIVDWIDSDSTSSANGAESDYYLRLASPSECKNSPILYLKELLNINNITASSYSKPLTTVCSYPVSNETISSLHEQINQTSHQNILTCFSAYGNGRININTASHLILSILPGLNEFAATSIINYRSGPDLLIGTEDDICIENADNLSNIDGLGSLEIELLSQYCCFESDTFRLFSCAKNKTDTCLLMATVKVTENNQEILSIERLL